jgi:hypothetical protein
MVAVKKSSISLSSRAYYLKRLSLLNHCCLLRTAELLYAPRRKADVDWVPGRPSQVISDSVAQKARRPDSMDIKVPRECGSDEDQEDIPKYSSRRSRRDQK